MLAAMTPAIFDVPEMVVRWSVEDYEQLYVPLVEQGLLSKRVELIRGLLIKKMPKSPVHGYVAKRLYDGFQALVPEGCTVRQEAPLRLHDSEPEPDVSVVQGGRRDFREVHPRTAALVVEVSVTTLAMDREYAPLYAENGVLEYWIIIVPQQQAEVYRRPENGLYQDKRVYTREQTLVCESVPALRVELSELFG